MRMWTQTLLLLYALMVHVSGDQILGRQSTPLPAPIIAAPSESWDGIDGPWSTAHLHIGSPRQDLRVLVSTAGQETWVVIPPGCDGSDLGNNCLGSRGRIFDYTGSLSWQNASAIWNSTGIYDLGTVIGYDLGLTGNGFYGFDTVGLSWQTSNITLNHTIVAGIATETYWLGQIGISPRSTNFTSANDNSSSFTDPQPSFFSLLKSQNLIPSLSYSFNPGSYYRSSSTRNAFMSLVFGGYDTSRFVPNEIRFGMNPDAGRELTVGVRSISKSTTATDGSTTSSPLLSNRILARLDSSQPYIWLPLAACRLFEQAFGLVWDNSTELYLVNDTLHQKLVSENANVNFALIDGLLSAAAVNITLPYGAFDLQALPPLVSNATRYFPLKRAANETQYVLGRTFLQEVYLTADYERYHFNVSQAVWNDTAMPDIRVISSLIATGGNGGGTASGLSAGAVAGIVVSILVLVLLIVNFLYWIRRRRQAESKVAELTAIEMEEEEKKRLQTAQSISSRAWTMTELDKDQKPDELDSTYTSRFEVSGTGHDVGELDGNGWSPTEADGNYTPVEMDGQGRVEELAGVPMYELHAGGFEKKY